MTTTSRALDENEAHLVEQSKDVAALSTRDLTDLVRQLRQRRERVQRMIRQRTRSARQDGQGNLDTGAREKKTELMAAIERVNQELSSRNPAHKTSKATQNLRAAVERKAEAKTSEQAHRTAETGPAETPNEKIAPSGALHAEGHRVALGRSRGR